LPPNLGFGEPHEALPGGGTWARVGFCW
jgi:hypothetical protein